MAVRIADKLTAFIETVRSAGMNKAASKMGYKSHTTVHTYIKDLEKELGYQLFERIFEKKIQLTHLGKLFYHSILDTYDEKERINTQIEKTIKKAHHGFNTNVEYIRILTTTGMLCLWLIEKLAKYLMKNNDKNLILSTIQHSDEVKTKDFDIAILPKTPYLDKLDARLLTTFHSHMFASRDYLIKNGTPKKIADVSNHHLISFYTGNYDWGDVDWHVNQDNVRHSIALGAGLVHAAKCGMGIISIPEEYPGITKDLVKVLPSVQRKIDIYFAKKQNYNSPTGDEIINNLKNRK